VPAIRSGATGSPCTSWSSWSWSASGAPRDRNKTLTAPAGAEPVTGTKLPAVQRLQFFLSESVWDPERLNGRRLELLLADPVTAPHGAGCW
jgi:hypothetical protein